MTKRLGDAGIKAFANREIDTELAVRLGIYTAARGADGAVVPSDKGNIIVFPFIDGGAEVGAKYRGPKKKFWQQPGGRRTFWNADSMDDEALADGRQALIITEGEIDCLSALQVGFPFAVSVPDGAPSPPKDGDPEKLEPLDPEAEQTGKFEFMFNNRERLKRIKRFIIATDNDAPGKRLAAELVRRLSPSRCSFLTWPTAKVVPGEPGDMPRACKDLNEILMYLGPQRLVEVVNAAKPYPVRGLYRLSDYPEHAELEAYACGFDGYEHDLRLTPGEFMVVSGIPSHGKSRWVLDLLHRLRARHGWRAAIYSPEMPTVPVLRDCFRRLILDRKPLALETREIADADSWIEDSFTFIDTDPTGAGDMDEAFDVDWIIDRATDAVLRDGIRVLVIDPWNEVEHARGRSESMPDYIARAIRALKRFGRLYGVAVIVVAHPTKDIVGRDGQARRPSLYDIDGAAHWYNKADHGVIVHRPNPHMNDAEVHVIKVKHIPELGRPGVLKFVYQTASGRFLTPVEAPTA